MRRSTYFKRGVLPLVVVLLASPALARPLSVGLDVPGLSLAILANEDAPGPTAQPPAPPPPSDLPDVVTLRDGRVYRGRVLYQVQGGLLFSDPRFPQSFVIPFGDIANVQHPGGQPPPPTGITAQRLMLEAQLRDLQLRADALTVFPAIGTMAGGAISIGIGIMLYSLYNQCSNVYLPNGNVSCVTDSTTQTDAIIFGLLAGIPGAVALLLGTLELISVTNRQAELEHQIAQVKHDLAQLGAVQAGVAPPPHPPALLTLHF